MQGVSFSRRKFLTASSAAAAALLLPGSRASADEFKTKLHKAQMVGKVVEAEMTAVKAAGFEGVEARDVCAEDVAAKIREWVEKMGLRVHSVLLGWMEFNSPDPKKVEASIEKVKAALRAAKGYGSDAILAVPCRVDAKLAPPPGTLLQLEFDERNGHINRIVKDENEKYAEYIKAHDYATDSSRAAVEKLIPLAEELKVVIGLENVWNNLWLKPEIYKHFVASFKSPWVKAYFDIGNHVRYSPPEEWIKILGPLLVKLHMKDYHLGQKKFVQLRDGSVDWPAVRKALDEAGYNGWGTIEGGALSLEELDKRFDLICAGK